MGLASHTPTEGLKTDPLGFLYIDYGGGYLIYREGPTPTNSPPATFYLANILKERSSPETQSFETHAIPTQKPLT